MPKPVVFKSNSIGNLSVFREGLRDREESVSITFDDGFDFTDRSPFLKVYIQLEPPEVMDYIHKTEFPQVQQTTKEQLLESFGFYDLILTWDEEILRKCGNAVFFPAALCTWIDKCYEPFCKKDDSDEDNRGHDHNQPTNVPAGVR